VTDHEEDFGGWEEVIVAQGRDTLDPELEEGLTPVDKITRADKVEEMAAALTTAMDEVYQGKFDVTKTERMAALALGAQMELAKFLADAEWRAKQGKQEVKYISAEAHGKYKSVPSEKKLTDAALEHLVNKDKDVRSAESKLADLEREVKKWQYVHGTLKDAHVFFRNLGKQ
jgi:hypothetical protein